MKHVPVKNVLATNIVAVAVVVAAAAAEVVVVAVVVAVENAAGNRCGMSDFSDFSPQ
jgi:hypothetical protein